MWGHCADKINQVIVFISFSHMFVLFVGIIQASLSAFCFCFGFCFFFLPLCPVYYIHVCLFCVMTSKWL